MLDKIIGIAAGICTAVSLLPQLIKIIKEKRSENLSFPFLFILFVGLGLWIWYGLLREDLPIILTNAVSAVFNASIIVLGIKYSKLKEV